MTSTVPEQTAEPATEPVSAHCATGKHARCLGTTYVGRTLARCGCPVADCGHGSDEAKAKRPR